MYRVASGDLPLVIAVEIDMANPHRVSPFAYALARVPSTPETPRILSAVAAVPQPQEASACGFVHFFVRAHMWETDDGC